MHRVTLFFIHQAVFFSEWIILLTIITHIKIIFAIILIYFYCLLFRWIIFFSFFNYTIARRANIILKSYIYKIILLCFLPITRNNIIFCWFFFKQKIYIIIIRMYIYNINIISSFRASAALLREVTYTLAIFIDASA